MPAGRQGSTGQVLPANQYFQASAKVPRPELVCIAQSVPRRGKYKYLFLLYFLNVAAPVVRYSSAFGRTCALLGSKSHAEDSSAKSSMPWDLLFATYPLIQPPMDFHKDRPSGFTLTKAPAIFSSPTACEPRSPKGGKHIA